MAANDRLYKQRCRQAGTQQEKENPVLSWKKFAFLIKYGIL